MLHLIAENKGGKNFKSDDANNINLRSLFRTSEDSLTSSVFGLLFYLPVELMWTIMSKACYDNSVLPKNTGKLLSYEFWPRWKYLEQNTYKEPDIIIRFEEFDLIVEAKRWESGQQYEYQWHEEIKTYFDNYSSKENNGTSQKPVYLLAIGGINDTQASKFQNVIIVRCRWHMLLKQIIYYNKQFQKSFTISTNDAILNILNDLILAFGIHGYVTGDLLESISTDYKLNDSVNRMLNLDFYFDFKWGHFEKSILNINQKNINTLI